LARHGREAPTVPNVARAVGWWWWLGSAACALACQGARPAPVDTAGVTRVSVTRPTVVAYFVIPPGAVDTLPDLAVEADDWNVAMAALGDSLEASGIGLAIATEPRVRLAIPGRPDTTLVLGAFRASGYVFLRPGARPCMRPGGADADSVTVMARAFANNARCANDSVTSDPRTGANG
jgi:hypothetical protein